MRENIKQNRKNRWRNYQIIKVEYVMEHMFSKSKFYFCFSDEK